MKKLLLLIFAVSISVSVFSQTLAKSSTENKKPIVVSLYPLAFFSSNFMVGFEHGINKKMSGRINAAVGYSDRLNYYEFESNNFNNVNSPMMNQEAFYIEGQFRFYPGESVTNGIYIAPYLLSKSLNFDVTLGTYNNQGALVEVTSHKKMSAIGGGVLVGYQYEILDIMSLDVYLGGGPLVAKGDYSIISFSGLDPWKKGMVAQFGLNIGVKIR